MSDLLDAAARQQIREALDRTFLVEAAAGTGKTSELVLRILQVILSGRGRLGSIAALTFTEKAAGEMKLRLRTELDRALFDAALPQTSKQRARVALSELETANIGTIHGFCAELLRTHPIEAGVDPAFEVAETERRDTLIAESFERWFAALLEDPPEGVQRVLKRREVDSSGKGPDQQLRAAVSELIDRRDFDTPYRRDAFDRAGSIEAVHAALAALAQLHLQGTPGDALRGALSALHRQLERAKTYDLDAREAFLRKLAKDREVWREHKGKRKLYGAELARADVVAQREAAHAQLLECVRACDADLAACLSSELRGGVHAYEAAKAAAGLLDFFDLLLLTRQLLQSSDAVRVQLQAAFSHVFVDEFQDTDPVQSEIVLLLCADEPRVTDAWRVRPLPGKLFLVGDPKQSIYRFRRADIALYERVKRHVVAQGAEVLQLTTNFRTLPGIASAVNVGFARAMSGEQAGSGQPGYVPLNAYRSDRPAQPALVALPVPHPYGASGRITKTAISASFPRAVAAWVDWLVRQSGYVVHEQGRDVPVEARHVCLLFRRFRGFDKDITRDYSRALEARRLPHVCSGARSFHLREEVVAMRNVLTAIEWPDDLLHVYATLRGPLVAFHDETLFTFKQRVGHLHPLRPVDTAQLDDATKPVAEVLDMLGSLHAGRNRVPIASTLSRWLESVRAHAGIAIWPTGEQALGNVLRVLDFARAYERRGTATSFRGFVEWLGDQAESMQTSDAAVVEESSDGVRIMTVHAAKGLEFPVVVLCDPTAPDRPEHASRFIEAERQLWAQSLCEAQPVELWEQRDRVREHDAAEIVRLAYVAATRARDLLVVPACGEGPVDAIGGWLRVLSPAIYPAREHWRTPLPNPSFALPAFGPDSVSGRRDGSPEDAIAPGVHAPEQGQHSVVFWDPNLLEGARGTEPAGGVAQQDLLRQADDQPGGERGQAEYARFVAASELLRGNASAPSLISRSVTRSAHADAAGVPLPFRFPFSIIDTQPERAGRPRGPRFGSLVHALFERCDFTHAGPQELAPLAAAIGRGLGASTQEIAAAVSSVRSAIAQPFFARVRAAAISGGLYRETALIVRAPSGELLDGVIDLAFREPNETGTGERLCVADFKTDAELVLLDAYRTQLERYAEGAQAALGLPVITCLVRV